MFYSSTNAGGMPPTLFEVSMSNNFQQSLKTGFDYFLNIVSSENGIARAINARNNEVFSGLMFFVERYFLLYYDASFSENFYGLKRVLNEKKVPPPPSSSSSSSPSPSVTEIPLPPMSKFTSLLELVVLPYLIRKAKVEHLDVTDPRVPPWKKMLRNLLAWYEVSILAFQISYLFGKSTSFHPLHYLQSISLSRLTQEDVKKHALRAAESSATSGKSFTSLLFGKFYEGVKFAFLFSAVIIKFAEFYFSPAMQNNVKKASALLVPPPPQPPRITPFGIKLLAEINNDTHLCPLCRKVRENPTISTGGFCFCFSCIQAYVETNQKCPMTDVPCKVENLIRIYISA